MTADAATLSSDEIRFERRDKAGLVTLTRPKALNAVNHDMVRRLHAALKAWEDEDQVAVIVIRGEGRAFSAGGDILAIYQGGMSGNPPYEFFADEYRLNAYIARYPKPYVAIIDGIVMGGGVGVSFHGSHRVVTENAMFAMPEVGIGFFPDVGGSHLLPQAPADYGLYLGLTGNRIRWGDVVGSRLATHAVASADQDKLVEALSATGDPDGSIATLAQTPPRETDEATLHSIGELFRPETFDDLMLGLEAASDRGNDFAKSAVETLTSRSPTSVKVTFAQIRAGAMLDMDECMRMEYRILSRMLKGHDFYEGIRAAIVEKGSTPVWRPAKLDEVSEADVDRYFAALGADELVI